MDSANSVWRVLRETSHEIYYVVMSLLIIDYALLTFVLFFTASCLYWSLRNIYIKKKIAGTRSPADVTHL